jgi:hypothetical protein
MKHDSEPQEESGIGVRNSWGGWDSWGSLDGWDGWGSLDGWDSSMGKTTRELAKKGGDTATDRDPADRRPRSSESGQFGVDSEQFAQPLDRKQAKGHRAAGGQSSPAGAGHAAEVARTTHERENTTPTEEETPQNPTNAKE